MDNDGVGEHGNEKIMGPEEALIGGVPYQLLL